MDRTNIEPDLLGRNLRFLREVMDVTQEEAARQLRMSRTSYLALEAGRKQPTPEDLRLILRATRMNLDDLIGTDLRKQVVCGVLAAELGTDLQSFAREYLKLSARGRAFISRRIRRMAGEDTAFKAAFSAGGILP